MSTPANIRVNIGAPFPSLVKATGPVSIAKNNGIWTVGLSVSGLAIPPLNTDPTTLEALIWNTVAQTWQVEPIANIAAGVLFQRLVTAAGNIAVGANDRIILVKQTVPAAVSIILPAAASRNSIPITVKDLAGVALANPLTFVPNGVETIDGAASAAINDNFEAMTLNPITAPGGPAGWWIG